MARPKSKTPTRVELIKKNRMLIRKANEEARKIYEHHGESSFIREKSEGYNKEFSKSKPRGKNLFSVGKIEKEKKIEIIKRNAFLIKYLKNKNATYETAEEIARRRYESFKASHGNISVEDYNRMVKILNDERIKKIIDARQMSTVLSELIVEFIIAEKKHGENLNELLDVLEDITEDEQFEDKSPKFISDYVLLRTEGFEKNEAIYTLEERRRYTESNRK